VGGGPALLRGDGVRDYGLFDFRVDPDGRPWFLEAGLYCSFARTSVVVMMAAQAGVGLGELFAGMVTRAAGRRGRV
jgi:D-alanine-D-alanine ligase